MGKRKVEIRYPKDWFVMNTQQTRNAPQIYEIRVVGHLSANWATRFEGLSMRHEPEGETVLSGKLDQAALHGVLVKIRNLGLNLISVNRVDAPSSN
jgi:hypothetical protein